MTPHEAWTAALAAAARHVRRHLQFDDQRAVSWHEVNDAIAAIRTLPPPPDLAEPRASEEFRRGQESMREQAARECERLVGVHEFTEIDVTATQNDLRRAHARRIRALPLAEPAESQRAATCETCDGRKWIQDPMACQPSNITCPDCGGLGERR